MKTLTFGVIPDDLSIDEPYNEQEVEALLNLAGKQGDVWRARAKIISNRHKRERKELSNKHTGELLDAYKEWRLGVR